MFTTAMHYSIIIFELWPILMRCFVGQYSYPEYDLLASRIPV